MRIRDLRRHGVGVDVDCVPCWNNRMKSGSAAMESHGDVELVPRWNDAMNGYLALLRAGHLIFQS
jgi:hypothetical protein